VLESAKQKKKSNKEIEKKLKMEAKKKQRIWPKH